ncbi:hypothetical protein PR202_ga07342 [Eleusine coracana subsp. coracana]|uniref:Uncharacterized protein n=1 Tax=Eleusine coracana subsp. coracana TaxID=191504 RepID=A0AAV5BZR9_ELECO|nr:hypothetical protein PR202_ga07342 [Eleusine coracana subsp. coracana]
MELFHFIFCPSARRMYNAVFQILRNSNSLELVVASFHLLLELGKQFPRTYMTNSGSGPALAVVKELFFFCVVVCKRFSLLIEDLVELTNPTDVHNRMKAIKNMMSFQYLVITLEADFVPRHVAYKGELLINITIYPVMVLYVRTIKKRSYQLLDCLSESLDWVIFRESLLNMLLVRPSSIGSRKLVFKSFVKNCMFTLLNQYRQEAKDAVEDSIPSEGASDVSSLNLSFQLERTLISLRKLFVMVMNLDLIRKEADTLGLTSRSDGFRIPIMEVILDELTYNISYLSPFLSAFVEWKWKLEIILQYFSKYCGKTAVRTRRSDNSQQDLKLESVLGSFLTATSAKAIVKKMSSEVAQLLLAHAYQVCLSVQDDSSDTTAATEKIGATLQQISCNLISAFQNLRKVKPNIQISPFEKEALFTAATFSRKLKNQES